MEEQAGSDDSLCRVDSAPGDVKLATRPDAASQLDALYAEVDLSKKRQQRSTSSGLGLSGPVNSMMQQRFPDNRLSLSGLTRSVRDSRVDSGSVDMETPLSLSPKSPLALHLEISEPEPKKPIPPPRTRIPRKDSDNSVNSVNSVNTSTLSGLSDVEPETSVNGTTSALGELGQAIDSAIASMTAAAAAAEHCDYDVPKPPRSLRVRSKMMTSEVHDYAEIYTPSKEKLPGPWGQMAGPAGRNSQQSSAGGSVSDDPDLHDDSKPPTPPLHRFPSWESRIYQAAAEGFSVSEQPPSLSSLTVDGSAVNGAHLRRLSAAGYQDINIPVYATVKGVTIFHLDSINIFQFSQFFKFFSNFSNCFQLAILNCSGPVRFDRCRSAAIHRTRRTEKTGTWTPATTATNRGHRTTTPCRRMPTKRKRPRRTPQLKCLGSEIGSRRWNATAASWKKAATSPNSAAN